MAFSYVLPLTLKNRYGGERARLILLRDTLQKFHPEAKVYAFCPSDEVSSVRRVLSFDQFDVQSEDDLLQGRKHPLGWRTQQMVKLAAHQLFDVEEYYTTIDADNFLIRPFERRYLFLEEGKSFFFEEENLPASRLFLEHTLEYLGIKDEGYATLMPTPPFTFHVGAVKSTVEFVADIKKKFWLDALSYGGWQELSLYFIAGRKQNWWSRVHQSIKWPVVAVYYSMLEFKRDLKNNNTGSAYACMHSAGGVSALYVRRLLREFEIL